MKGKILTFLKWSILIPALSFMAYAVYRFSENIDIFIPY